MTSIISHIRSAAAKRAAYNRTVSELSAMDTTRAVEDLGIYPGDASRIANRAVYGA